MAECEDELGARAHLINLVNFATGVVEFGVGNEFMQKLMREGRFVALVVWDESCHHTIAITTHPVRAIALDRARKALGDGHYVGSKTVGMGEENGEC